LSPTIRERAGEGGIAVEIDPFPAGESPVVVIREPGEALEDTAEDREEQVRSDRKSESD